MKKSIAIVLSAALSLSLVLSACGGGSAATPAPSSAPSGSGSASQAPSEPIKIIFANYGNSAMPPAQGDREFIGIVEEATNGGITFDYVPDGVLGGEADMIQQIMDGTIQVAALSPATFNTFTKLTEVFQLPFLLTDYETEYTALNSPEAKAIYDKLSEELGVKIVGAQENGIRHFANNTRPVTSVADLKGLKLRIAPSNMLTEVMTNLGASPITVPYAEVYSALQNKVVDGEEINITSIYALKHYEVVKYISEIGMYPFPVMITFNLDFWNSLSAEYQQIILDAAATATKTEFETYLPEFEATAIAACKDAGVQFNTIEGAAKDEFIALAKPTWDKYRAIDPLIANFIDMVENMK